MATQTPNINYEQQVSTIIKKINSLQQKKANKLYRLFYEPDYFNEQICELYESLIRMCLITLNYDAYYKYILEYNTVLEEIYKYNFDTIIKRTQITNVKALLDVNIYDKIQQPQRNTSHTPVCGPYYDLIDIYMTYNMEIGNTDTYISAVEKIVKLYMTNKDKYNCNIFKYLDKYYEITCLYHKKHGDILFEDKKYNDAIRVYQSYINTYITDSNLKYSVPSYIYNMMLCYMLNGDDIATEIKYKEIANNYPTLETNYEFKFIIKIVDAYLKKDVDTYVNVIAEQDSIRKLNDTHIEILLSIKHTMQTTDDLC